MYLHTSAYSIHKNIPFSVYGENLIILFQNLVIIFLFWSFSKTIGFTEKLFLAISIAAYSYILFQDKYVNEQGWNMIQSSNILFMVLSRVPQIFTNFKNKSTG